MGGTLHRTVLFGGILLAVCVAIVSGGLLSEIGNTGTSAFWFIGLLVVITATLTLTAIVFGALNLSNANEAFGLPSGSIRTLLAVGIMVLFAVFGLRFFADTQRFDQAQRLSEKPVEVVEAAYADKAAEVQRYEAQGFVAVVSNAGRAAGTNGAADPGANARISLYTREPRRSADAIDVQKQLLTSIVTLLTTVVGFYFGTRSATEGVRNANEAAAGPDAGGLGTERDQLQRERQALDTQLATERETLAALQAQSLPTDAAQAREAGDLLSQALEAQTQAAAAAQQADAAAAAAQAAIAAVATASAGTDRSAREADAASALARLREAQAALQQLVQQLQAHMAALQKLMAEG